jgi:hypothetical protein
VGGPRPDFDLESIADALRRDQEAIGRDFDAAMRQLLAPFVEHVRAEVLGKLLPHRCPLCADRFTTAIGAKAHYSVGHSWWERLKSPLSRRRRRA